MRRVLADRDARVLFAGQTCSLFGDSAMFLVIAIEELAAVEPHDSRYWWKRRNS